MLPDVIQTLSFRHSGTPAHHGEDYLQWLIAVYPEKWIRRGGSFELPVQTGSSNDPQRSMVFLIWEHQKEQV
jgi:hypothetical protein